MPFLNRDSNCSGSMPSLSATAIVECAELFALIIGIGGTKGGPLGKELSAMRESNFSAI